MLPKQIQNLRQSSDWEDSIITAHHVFMTKYGWIPLEEFRNLPIPTFMSLMNQLNKEAEAEKNALNKSKRRR